MPPTVGRRADAWGMEGGWLFKRHKGLRAASRTPQLPIC
jgi:hypothetical protein